MTKKLFLTGICTAAILLLSHLLSSYAFAADSDGAAEVRRLEMGLKNVTLRVNQDRSLYVNISPAYADDKTITWASSDDSVVTVQDNGEGRAVITGVSEGKAKITATSHNGKTAVCTVTVSDDEVKVSRLEMSQDTATVRVNQERILFVEIFPYDADDKTIAWTSGNPEVVMVEGDGTIIGVSPGTAEITATSHNGKTAVCTVTVPAAVLKGLEQQVPNQDHPLAEVDGGGSC